MLLASLRFLILFIVAMWRVKGSKSRRVEYWEIIVEKMKKAGFGVGWVSAIDDKKRTVWIVDAHGYGKRFVVRADEKLTAFVELERAINDFAVSLTS